LWQEAKTDSDAHLSALIASENKQADTSKEGASKKERREA
jgi:hypothetical protein